MKPITLAISLAASLLVALPAMAQNASQISRVRAGHSCAGCNLFQGDFTGLEVNGLNLSNSRLRQSDFSLAVMNRTNLSGTDMRDIEAYGAVFSGANLSGANLANASLVGVYLDGANFRGTNLSGTNLSGASLARAKGLSQAQLNQACGDSGTRLPSGLRIPAC